MPKKLLLEQITFEEFNRSCQTVGVKPDLLHSSRRNVNMGRVRSLRPNLYLRVQNRSDIDYVQLEFNTFPDILEYFSKLGVIQCVHPFGFCGISDSERRTLNGGVHYFDSINGLEFDTLLVRLKDRSNRLPQVEDSLIFKKEPPLWILRKLKILTPNSGMYDLGNVHGYLRQHNLPITGAIYPAA